MQLIFATHNKNKLKEVKTLLPKTVDLLSLDDLQLNDEIEETEITIEGNALLKAKAINKQTSTNCFADDSGLLVDALNGAPGVYSARYAGEPKNDDNNIDKLLLELTEKNNRSACFKTVMALIFNGKEYVFEGIIYGKISFDRKGNNGFGYDPVFIPDGYTKTFAEMEATEKNAISHRGIALKKMVEFLNTI